MSEEKREEVPNVVGLMENTLRLYASQLESRGISLDVICDNLAAAGAALGTRAAAMIREIDKDRDPIMAITTILSHLEVTARNQGVDMVSLERISRKVWNTLFPTSLKCMACGRLIEEPSPFEENVSMGKQYRNVPVRGKTGPEHPECHFLANSRVTAAPTRTPGKGKLHVVKDPDPDVN